MIFSLLGNQSLPKLFMSAYCGIVSKITVIILLIPILGFSKKRRCIIVG
jgi:hypothetical protein